MDSMNFTALCASDELSMECALYSVRKYALSICWTMPSFQIIHLL